MRIVPVLDVQGGVVVHGVRGKREEYRPIRSTLCDGARPVDVARAFRSQLGLDELYVADLDAIAGGSPSCPLYRELCRDGFRLWVDPGVRTSDQARWLLDSQDIDTLVVGLETIESALDLQQILDLAGDNRICVSLDLKEGRPLARHGPWRAASAQSVLEDVARLGFRQILLLDLARVGSGEGVGTEELVRTGIRQHSGISWYVGGGVRGPEDVRRLGTLGVSGTLVASALHDGRIQRQDLDWKLPEVEIY